MCVCVWTCFQSGDLCVSLVSCFFMDGEGCRGGGGGGVERGTHFTFQSPSDCAMQKTVHLPPSLIVVAHIFVFFAMFVCMFFSFVSHGGRLNLVYR